MTRSLLFAAAAVLSACATGASADTQTTEPAVCEPAANVCTTNWVNIGEGWAMTPGRACGDCHTSGLVAAGTIYPELIESDDCGGMSGVEVILTDANGQSYSTTSGSTGNFAFPTWDIPNFAYPYTVKIRSNGVERQMLSSASSVDCNACHSAYCPRGAPGRIVP